MVDFLNVGGDCWMISRGVDETKKVLLYINMKPNSKCYTHAKCSCELQGLIWIVPITAI